MSTECREQSDVSTCRRKLYFDGRLVQPDGPLYSHFDTIFFRMFFFDLSDSADNALSAVFFFAENAEFRGFYCQSSEFSSGRAP